MSYCQIVTPIVIKGQSMEELGGRIVEFWKESDQSSRDSDSFIVHTLDDLSIGKYLEEKNHIPFHPLNNALLKDILKEKQGIYLLGYTNLDSYHIMVIEKNVLFLINMSNALSDIIIQVTSSFSYSNELLEEIVKEVVRTHRSNWYLNHRSQVEKFLESQDVIFIDDIDNYPTDEDFNNLYNPNEW